VTEAAARPPIPSDDEPAPLAAAPAIALASLDLPKAPASGMVSALPGGSSAPDHVAAPWGAAVDAGKTVGRVSQDSAVAAAGVFSRLGKRIASSF
jgi:hypothetical protein